jgi:uncharacterized membrane protein
MATTNPYAAPKAAVADASVVHDADFIADGQPRPAGHGWTWITEGWELFKRQPGAWIGIVLIAFVIFILVALIPFVGGLLLTLFGPVFAGGVMIGCRSLDSGSQLEIGHLFAGFKEKTGTLVAVGAIYLGASLVVMLVVGLTMGVGMAAMMGQGDPQQMQAMGMTMVLAMLIMFALLLPVVMAIWLAPPLVVFHEQGAIEAMKASFFGCLKNIVPFLVYGIVLFVFMILASIPLGLGWLVLGPVFAASIYASYCDIYLRPRG